MLNTINGSDSFLGLSPGLFYEPWSDSSEESREWVKIPQPRKTNKETEESRHLRPETFHRISETLGALNTVGRYIVNMTRGVDSDRGLSDEVPSAIYTLSKNVLGRNVTDTIAPFVREALPNVIPPTATIKPTEAPNSRSCTTPEGLSG